jgi:hypothetical protein
MIGAIPYASTLDYDYSILAIFDRCHPEPISKLGPTVSPEKAQSMVVTDH